MSDHASADDKSADDKSADDKSGDDGTRSTHTAGSKALSGKLKGPKLKVTNPKGSDSGTGAAAGDDSLENEFTQDKLNKLHDLFEEMDEDGGGGLDMDEFTNAIKATMGNISDKEIELLFMKVDANCDGAVDWDEYLSYTLMEIQEKSQMNAAGASHALFTPEQFQSVTSNHRDTLTKILFVPNIFNSRGDMLKEVDYAAGRYFSVGKDGRINLWNTDVRLTRTVSIDNMKNVSMHVTDCATMANVNMLAVTTTDRNVLLYDVSGGMFERKYEIVTMPYSPLAIDYWFDFSRPHNAIMVVGDDGGNVFIIQFTDIMQTGPFGNNVDKFRPLIPFKDLMLQKYPTAITKYMEGIHTDWIIQIKYIEDLECFISCDGANEKCLYMGDLYQKKANHHFEVTKGISSFDYCEHNNILITGGCDHTVRIWNPYMPGRPVAVLTGHTDAVTHVCSYADRDQCITVSKDRNLRIFDVHDHSCLLNFQLKNFGVISALCFNPVHKILLMGSNELAMFHQNMEEAMSVRQVSHEAPVTGCLYNPIFNIVASVCQSSSIIVWNMTTGEKEMQFRGAHTQISGDCELVGVEITAMQFDPTYRRLVTGARNGSVKVWNFNNGACLREIDDSTKEVTGLMFPRDRLIVCGWDKVVFSYIDGEDDIPAKAWLKKHQEDILSCDYYEWGSNGAGDDRSQDGGDGADDRGGREGTYVATASYDGDIILWEMETGHMVYRLNASEGILPQSYFKKKVLAIKNKLATMTRMDRLMVGARDSIAAAEKEKEKAISLALEREARAAFQGRKANNSRKEMTEEGEVGSVQTAVAAAGAGNKLTTMMKGNRAKAVEKQIEEMRRRVSYMDQKEKIGANNPQHHLAVERLLFLKSRAEGKDTAQLIAGGAHGWVRAWSIHREGGLLAQFNAAEKHFGESVVGMDTDTENKYLITGDSQGYIKVWLIAAYCTTDPPADFNSVEAENAIRAKFPYTRMDKTKPNQHGKDFVDVFDRKYSVAPPASLPAKTLKVPPLLTSFRGHTKAITSVAFANEYELIVSSSYDCTVRVWTIGGRHVGTFGQKARWKAGDLTVSTMSHSLPDDIRRQGSAHTLKVLNAGGNSKWSARKQALLTLSRMRIEARHKREANYRSLGLLKEGESLDPSYDPGTDPTASDPVAVAPIPVDDLDLPGDVPLVDMSEDAMAAASKSDYLGMTFKAPGKHRAMPKVTIKHIENTCQIQVYTALNFKDLSYMDPPADVIADIRSRNERLKNPKYDLPLLDVKKRAATEKPTGKARGH